VNQFCLMSENYVFATIQNGSDKNLGNISTADFITTNLTLFTTCNHPHVVNSVKFVVMKSAVEMLLRFLWDPF